MSERPPTVEEVFLRASELPTHERSRFLDERCADDSSMREEIDSLLRAHDRPGTFLDTPAPVRLDLFVEQDPAHPDRVGPYDITRALGAGGMGIVYLAEGGRPRRRVALKVLRTGIATSSMRRRFEMESEALARLQHPGIAQVYEAGTARVGSVDQPFIAMELVEGVPLTDHAAQRGMSTRERLALVAEVADAVQHAHQRGVVHRDLKPGNVLVNAEGRPKVLDFGVARLADPAASGANTATGQMIGTLAYMSPEQVAGDVAAVDARSDVYALGVILYELLAGRPPLAVSDRAITDAARAIREDEPASLSTIDRSLRGDVDTIVRKAMDKSPERRYQSASELAADIRRFLNEEPIVARPPSTLYQLRKFARRNKAIVAGVGAVIVVLAGGVVGTSLGMVRAMEQEQLAREAAAAATVAADAAKLEAAKASEAKNFLQSVLTGADTPNQGVGGGLDLTVREVVRRAAVRVRTELEDMPDVASDVHQTIGETFALLGDLPAAEEQLRLALAAAERFAPAPSTPYSSALNSLAWLAIISGDPAKGEQLVREALDVPEEVLSSDREGHTAMLSMLGLAIDAQGRHTEAVEIWRQSLAIAEEHLPPHAEERLSAMNNIADWLATDGRLDEAAALMTEVEAVRRQTLGPTHPEYMNTLANLAVYEAQRYNFAASKRLYDQLIESYTRFYGPDHLMLARLLSNYGTMLRRMNDREGAEAAYRRAVDISRSRGVAARDRLGSMLQNLASLRHELGDFTEAESLFAEAMELVRESGVASDEATVLGNLASLRFDQGRWSDGEQCLRRALDLRVNIYGLDALPTLYAAQNLGTASRRLGRYDEALPLLERASKGIHTAHGEPNPTVALADAALGWCLALAGRPAEAEPILVAALGLMRGWESVNVVQLSAVEAAYGECMMALGRLDEADGALAAALERRREMQGPDHPGAMEIELMTARLRAAQGRAEEARALAQRVLDVQTSRLGECEATAETRAVLAAIGG